MAFNSVLANLPKIHLNTLEHPEAALTPKAFKLLRENSGKLKSICVVFYSQRRSTNIVYQCLTPVNDENFTLTSLNKAPGTNKKHRAEYMELGDKKSKTSGDSAKLSGCKYYDHDAVKGDSDKTILAEFHSALEDFNLQLKQTMLFFMDYRFGKPEFTRHWPDLSNKLPAGVINYQDEAGATPLINACSGSHLELIKHALSLKPDLSLRALGKTALGYCCAYADINCLKELLKHENALTDCDQKGKHITTFTAEYGTTEQHLAMIIDAGADVNGKIGAAERGMTPLIQSITAKTADTRLHKVNLLLSRNANTNTQNRDGDTALHYAVKYGEFACANALVQSGADINIRNDQGRDAFHCDTPKVNTKGKDISLSKSECLTQVLNQDYWFLAICMIRAGWTISRWTLGQTEAKEKVLMIQRGLSDDEEYSPDKSAVFSAMKSGDKRAARELYPKNKVIIGQIYDNPSLMNQIPEQYRSCLFSVMQISLAKRMSYMSTAEAETSFSQPEVKPVRIQMLQ